MYVLRLNSKICPVFRANTKEAAFGRLHKGGRLSAAPFVASFVLALNEAHVLALNAAHVLRLNKAEVLAFNKAHVMRPNNKICPMFRANTKETTRGGGRRPPPFVEAAEGRLLCVGSEHWAYLTVETQDIHVPC